MNFVTQFFFSGDRTDGTPRRMGFNDSDYDPFWQSDEEQTGVRQIFQGVTHGGKEEDLSNGSLYRRPNLISPDRLKDFGEEEYLNGEVRTWETTPLEQPEPQPTLPPKTAKKPESKSTTTPKTTPEFLQFEDISAAALKTVVQRTPCMYSRLSKQYGMEIFLKKEYLCYTGSVKERGVLHLLTTLKQDQQKRGVVVATDSNFSMAVAHHAAKMHIPVFVIMPGQSSLARLRMFRDYGAMVISYGNTALDSHSHARRLASENSYLYLEEDDSAVYMSGLGTVAMEIYEQVPKLDAVIVPTGGHCGLLAATATAMKHLNPLITVIGVEPEDFPLLLQSLKMGIPMKEFSSTPNRKLYRDLADPPLGHNAFQLIRKLVDKVISVREEDALVAMLRFLEYERSMVDIEGAMPLAAIMAGQLPELKGKRVAVLATSANMEPGLARWCLERALVLDGRISRFTILMSDWPGDMAKLLDLLAREDVRLLNVSFQRHGDRCDLFKTQVECVVETNDKTQVAHLKSSLLDRYPTMHWQER